ncbi:HAD family hydrolase [Pedobacter sp. SYSU D00535]|uniref:HAD family hydrolase n=1 Tax=Pedobacter sp. SYSU D00535 TaxID=2810308 RepID=UPI001A95D97B|nr:HAD-IA family hydrolase [Pedobacter sp. SYSU D00535]
MEKIKAVIFDLDGTLANTLPLCIQAFRESIEPLIDRSLADDEIVATFGPSEEGTIMALAPDHYDKGVADYLFHYERLHPSCSEPFDGMRSLLEELQRRKVPMAMVTGKGPHSAKISLDYFSLSAFFDRIETGSPTGPRKAEGIQHILNDWPNLRKEEVWYVGDAPSDITACRAAGIPIAAAAWAETAEVEVLRQLHPDKLFESVQDFIEWVLANVEE